MNLPGAELDATAAAPSPGASDADLAASARAGSRRAFGMLIERHQPHVLALLRRRVRSTADAEDLAQETFIRAWEKLDRFDPSRCFRTWVHTIAARLAIDHLRSRTASVRRDLAVGRERHQPHAPEHDLPPVWDTARRVLDDTPFTALWLRYVEGLETNQVARVLGKNRVAVSMILCRARARLATELTRTAGSPALAPQPQPAQPEFIQSPAAPRRTAPAAPGVST